MEKNKEIFVIRPSEKLNIKRIEKNVSKMDVVYDIGLKDAKKNLKKLKKYLEK